MTKETCLECGKEYTRLGMHWSHNPEHRPLITDKQRDVVIGTLMGDGCINMNGKNAFLQVEMISKNYLEYIDELFGVLGCGVRLKMSAEESAQRNLDSGFSPNAVSENYSDLYQVWTRKHPYMNEFTEWYDSGKKVWPDDIELTPTVLKHWYVGDGHLGNKNINITMCNESENFEKVKQYFNNQGLPTPCSWDGSTAMWSVEDSKVLFDYMGDALPDFEYKWP